MLAPHTKANREFFEKGCSPQITDWRRWVLEGIVRGKVIDGKPYIDLQWFAINDIMDAPMYSNNQRMSPLEFLTK
tara:strand:- start:506 stop:730 length:225 start_codon:yes stop_codon:yes gene_type:complete